MEDLLFWGKEKRAKKGEKCSWKKRRLRNKGKMSMVPSEKSTSESSVTLPSQRSCRQCRGTDTFNKLMSWKEWMPD